MDDIAAVASDGVSPSEGPGGDIQVIARVVTLLDRLDPDTPYLDTPTAARLLGVGRSTAHRYLSSLERHGLLARRSATTYEPGPVLRRLGTMALGRLGVVEAAGPVMRELAATVRNTVVLGVWGGRAPVVARVVPDTSRMTTISVEVGRTLDADSAQARVFTARRTSGRLHAVPDDLLEVGGEVIARRSYEGGVRTIAAPIRRDGGEVVASLAILGLAMHMPGTDDDATAAHLVDAAARIAAI